MSEVTDLEIWDPCLGVEYVLASFCFCNGTKVSIKAEGVRKCEMGV